MRPAPLLSFIVVAAAPSWVAGSSASHSRRSDLSAPEHLSALSKRASTFNYATDIVRGVNIGGWLVAEPWITPSLFKYGNKAVDEYTLGQYLGAAGAKKVLQQHWDTWFAAGDFAGIKAAGLNHVRIPIGYWAYDISAGEPYVQGQRPYMHKAIGWAKANGLRVMIDLHGLPGSQNGFDNSGRRGKAEWPNTQQNIQRTYKVYQQLVNEFIAYDNVAAIEPVNEVAGFYGDAFLNAAKAYYKNAYTVTRKKSASTLLTIHDAFMVTSYWSSFMRPPAYENVALDTHIYSVFLQELVAMKFDERVRYYCNMSSGLRASQDNIWTFVGEWTPAPTDCAPRLNGQGIGARYDGTYPGSTKVGSCNGKSGSASSFSNEYKVQLRKLFEVQTTVYEKAGGWFMWTWKAENADDWSYAAGLKGGWIPKNPTEKKYGRQCP